MIILGIETSCDETGAAVLQMKNGRIHILSNILASSAPLQAKYGGIIPEQAAREQIKSIIPVVQEAINGSRLMINDINAIAVAYGPGLIGSLLVGVETAKVLATVWKKPLIPVNHLLGHFYANFIEAKPSFPCIGLLVSGGHTDLVLFKNHGKYIYLGGTRDDAAGECFDKCARLLGLPYPGGPEISKLASQVFDSEAPSLLARTRRGDALKFNLPRPMIDSKNFDFSFSGLKTAVARVVQNDKTDLAASIEAAIVDVLVEKTIRAAKKYKVNQIMIAGGVAANQKLVSDLELRIKNLELSIKLHVPIPELCTDNAAMIAAAAFFQKPIRDPLKFQADPNLSLDNVY